tara:strand:- start:100919 stop:101338 length:420 start_codon:yes stop_codon:yes gene_type:complete
MTTNTTLLVAAALALVILTFLVGARLLYTRVQEMQQKRIHPQTVATSVQMSTRLENVQTADNFRNLFEVPVLFYALVATALAVNHTPTWLAYGALLFVALRIIHSFVHCTYNKVMHRLLVFLTSFVLIVGLWVSFYVTL